MSLRNFFMGLAGNFIAAGIGWYVKGPNTGLIIAGAGVVLLVVAYIFTNKPEIPTTPASAPIGVHQENKQEFSPQFNPQFNPQFSPQVYIGTAATSATAVAPAALPQSRPKIAFDKWDTLAENLDIWESGFRMSNHGETALDVQVQRFQIAPGQFARSRKLPTIAARGKGFIPVWLEQYTDAPHSREKWDLLAAMKSAFEAGREAEEYAVPITIRYKDFDENIYESTTELRYVHSRNELVFGSTKQRKVDASSVSREHETLVLAFLKNNPRPLLVANVASGVGICGEEAVHTLERLYAKDAVFRSSIDADGDFVYWYRGPANPD